MPAGSRFALIGAHLTASDAALDEIAVLPVGDLFVSGFEIPHGRNLAERAVVSGVAALRQQLIAREIFVAIRYGATALDAASAFAKCAPHLRTWRALLERWRGRVELVMRIGGAGAGARPDRAAYGSGADYLRALHAMRHAVPVDEAFLGEAESRFREIAEETRRVPREDGTIEIAAMTPRARIEEARAMAEELKSRRPGVPFLLSGPWPLEVFADEQ